MTKEEMIQKYREINMRSSEDAHTLNYLTSQFAALISWLKRRMDEKSFKWAVKWLYEIMSVYDDEWRNKIISIAEVYGIDPFYGDKLADSRLAHLQEELSRALNTFGEVKCSLLEYLEYSEPRATEGQEIRHNLRIIETLKNKSL